MRKKIHGGIVYDACCLINIISSGESRSILQAQKVVQFVPAHALEEIAYVLKDDPEGNGQLVRVPVEPLSSIPVDLVIPCELQDDDEIGLFVQIAMDVADGEASCLAVAASRGLVAATDDRKARTIARNLSVDVVSTPELVKRWSDGGRVSKQRVGKAISNIGRYASTTTLFPQVGYGIRR